MFGREEKVSSVRLTAVQYFILAIFLVLAYGLWRLQVMQSDKYSLLAEMNRIRNVPILGHEARSSIAKGASSLTTTLHFRHCCCAIPRAT